MGKIVLGEISASVPFWVCLVASIAVGIMGVFFPPQGVIDNSILKFIALLFGFATLWCVYQAIEKGIDAKIEHGDTTITVGDIVDDNK